MYRSILVPIDGSPTSERGLDEAITLAAALGSTLHLLSVVDTSFLIASTSLHAAPGQVLQDMRAAAERLVFEAGARAWLVGVAADTAVRSDPGRRVADSILLAAHDCHADLIVMGSHGRRGIERALLGSDAEQVLRRSPIPVLLLRAPAPA